MRRRIDAPAAALSGLVIGSLVAGPIASVRADEPFYRPAGELVPKSGTGRVDETLYSPDMRFPIEEGPAYPNSQVYGVGGYHGPSGGQCDNRNYSYPWWDNYCETRSWSMPMCPAGTGHQGQDIRPQTCKNAAHWTVSTVAGTVTNVPTNSSQYATYIVGADGTRYDYLHGADTPLAVGDKVTKGQRVDLVSNKFGGTPTTIHLHFNIRQDVGGYGFVYAPPYASLVHSYKQLMDLGSAPPTGAFAQASCEALVGWAHDEDTPEEPVTAVLYFDGHPSDPDNAGSGVEIVADLHDEALCESLGSCAHAFALEVPRSLRDGLEHRVYAFALDDGQGPQVELENSPQTFVCEPPALPPGIRRWIPTPEHLAAWQLSPFWELAKVSDAEIAAIPVGQDLGAEPTLLRADDGSPEVWILDHHLRRRIPSAEIAARWSLEIDAAELMPAGDLAAIPEGPPLRPEPWMVKGSGPWIYLLDDPLCGPGDLAEPLCAITPDDSDSDSDSDSSGDTDSGSDSGSDSGTDSATGGGSDSESAGSGGESADPGGGPALPQGYGEGGEDGCGCRSVTPGSRGSLWGLAWLLGIGLTRRRRISR